MVRWLELRQPVIGLSKKITDNNVYFMEIVSDQIIINNNYEGVIILDSDLKIVKEINIMDNLVIDLSFVNENEIVLCCYENHCLIYINLKSYEHKIILLDEDLNEVSFLHLYEWMEDALLLLADGGTTVIRVDVLRGSVQIKKDMVDGHYYSIYSNWDKINRFTIHKVYPLKREAIVEIDRIVRLIDYEKGTEMELKAEPLETAPYYFYDVEVMENCVLQVAEKRSIVWKEGEKFVFYPNYPWDRFFRAKFMARENNIYLMLLLGSDSDSTNGVIEKLML